MAGCEDKPTTVHEVKLFFIIRPYQYWNKKTTIFYLNEIFGFMITSS